MTNQEIIQARNLEFLRAEYGSDKQVVAGEKILRKGMNGKLDLSHLLRYHGEGIYGEEVTLRDQVDEFLEYCDLIEIALHLEFISLKTDKQYFSKLKDILSDKDVTKYYTKTYPIFLVQGLKRRLERGFNGQGNSIAKSEVNDQIKFMSFLSLTDSLYNDKQTDKFLWLLDDGYDYQANGLPQFIKVLDDPKKLARALSQKTNNDQYSELMGFSKFLNFSLDFDEFLSTCEDPVTQSAFYHHLRYWYHEMEDWVFEVEDAVFSRLQSIWESTQNSKEDSDDETYHFEKPIVTKAKVKSALERLKSNKYDGAYRNYIKG